MTSALGNNDHAKRTQEDTSRFPNWLHILESAGVDDDALDEDDESQGPIQVGGQHSADFEALQLYQQQQKEVMEKRMNDLSSAIGSISDALKTFIEQKPGTILFPLALHRPAPTKI